MEKEEKRFLAAALILAGLSANYNHGLIPPLYWGKGAVELADHLLKTLEETSRKVKKVSE